MCGAHKSLERRRLPAAGDGFGCGIEGWAVELAETKSEVEALPLINTPPFLFVLPCSLARAQTRGKRGAGGREGNLDKTATLYPRSFLPFPVTS